MNLNLVTPSEPRSSEQRSDVVTYVAIANAPSHKEARNAPRHLKTSSMRLPLLAAVYICPRRMRGGRDLAHLSLHFINSFLPISSRDSASLPEHLVCPVIPTAHFHDRCLEAVRNACIYIICMYRACWRFTPPCGVLRTNPSLPEYVALVPRVPLLACVSMA